MATTTLPEAAGGNPTSPVRAPRPQRRKPWFIEFYGTAVGKKYVMAITGLIGMGFITAHMVGNLKTFLGAAHLDEYAEWLRTLGEPALPFGSILWIMRVTLIIALALHLHSAYSLTMMNRRANEKYVTHRDYVAANFASRTMRWTGIIVLLFLVYHLMDFTWGNANPDFVRGNVYDNLIASFERIPVAIAYVIANLALGVHLWHGAWSLFQSIGWNHPRFNRWRHWFAWGFTIVVVAGYISVPIAIAVGIVD
jgi:succinate dehydrogenase / fumarate reductase, cytochrome b subunit